MAFEEQKAAVAVPGLTSGDLDDAALTEIGGWPFIPDLPWMNVQAYAFFLFHSRVRGQANAADESGALERLVNLISPTLHAQDGCTGLHWLDRSTLPSLSEGQRQDLLLQPYFSKQRS